MPADTNNTGGEQDAATGPFGMAQDEFTALQAAQAAHARGQRIADLCRREPVVRELLEEIEALRKQVSDSARQPEPKNSKK